MKKQKITVFGIVGIMTLTLLSGCGSLANTTQATTEAEVSETASTADMEASWNQDEVTGIVFFNDEISVEGDGAEVSGTTVTIREAGTYVLSGSLSDGQVVVDADSEAHVNLVLNGVELSNSHTSPIYGVQSGTITLTLEEGTVNTVQDAAAYTYENSEDDEPNAAIFSKDTLVINGTGSLIVNGNYECGIRSKDDLIVTSGDLIITSQSDGLKGKDSVVIEDGNIQITSGKDGIKSNNDSDPEKGYIQIDGGQITIAAQDDGIQAETSTVINGGEINITESQEGIAGLTVTINGGVINIVAQDDGINAAATVETEREKMMDQEGVYVRITGGEITIDATADGIDSNGDLYIEGGTILLSGPTAGGEGMFDYNGEGSITGGVVMAAGNSGMMQTFGTASTQPYLVVYYEANKTAETQFSLLDEAGLTLAEFAPAKAYNTVIISSPEIELGKTYTIKTDDETTEITVTEIENISGTPSGRDGGGFGGGGGGGMRGEGGRQEGDRAEGDRSAGEMPSGEPPTGEQPVGEPPAGDRLEGEPPAGQRPEGQPPENGTEQE